jgi:hypothetical protein
LETAQIQEQETGKQPSSLKLSASLKTNNLAGAKVAQVRLSAGNDKLQETSKAHDARAIIIAQLLR